MDKLEKEGYVSLPVMTSGAAVATTNISSRSIICDLIENEDHSDPRFADLRIAIIAKLAESDEGIDLLNRIEAIKRNIIPIK
jgi:hypothetical protein